MFRNGSGKVRSGWLFILAGLVALALQLLLITPFSIYLKVKNEFLSMVGLMDNHPLIAAWFSVSMQVALVLAVILMWVLIQRRPLRKIGIAGLGSGWKDVSFGFFLGAIAMFLIFLILWGTGSIRVGNDWNQPDFRWNNLLFLITFIMVGFAEEFFFRGYVIRTLEERDNPSWFIYGLSSIIFSFAHSGNTGINNLAFINLFLVGILFAYMFRVTGSLWLPVGFHVSWNFFQGVVFGLPVSGNPLDSIYHSQMVVGHDLMSGGGFGPEGGVLTTLLIGLCMMTTWLYGKKFTDRNNSIAINS